MRYQPSANISDFLSPSLGIGEVFGQGQVENAKDFAQAVNDQANTHRAGMLGEATIASAKKMGAATEAAGAASGMASAVSGGLSGVTRMAGAIFSPSAGGGGGGFDFNPAAPSFSTPSSFDASGIMSGRPVPFEMPSKSFPSFSTMRSF